MLGKASVVEAKALTLDKIYFCTQCRKPYLFEADVDYHRAISGHQDFTIVPFVGKSMER